MEMHTLMKKTIITISTIIAVSIMVSSSTAVPLANSELNVTKNSAINEIFDIIKKFEIDQIKTLIQNIMQYYYDNPTIGNLIETLGIIAFAALCAVIAFFFIGIPTWPLSVIIVPVYIFSVEYFLLLLKQFFTIIQFILNIPNMMQELMEETSFGPIIIFPGLCAVAIKDIISFIFRIFNYFRYNLKACESIITFWPGFLAAAVFVYVYQKCSGESIDQIMQNLAVST